MRRGELLEFSWKNIGRYELLLAALMLAYIVLFSYLSIAINNAYATHGDLTVHIQAQWSTLHALPLGSTYVFSANDFWSLMGGGKTHSFEWRESFLGIHMSPLLFLITPFFAIFQRVETILVAQTVLLAIGAVPIFLLAKEKFGSGAHGLAFAAIFLLNPALHGINLFDFHPIAMVVPMLLFAFYFLHKENDGYFALFAILSLMAEEEVAFSVFMLGLYALWKRRFAAGAFAITSSIVWFVLIVYVIMPMLHGGPYMFTGYYGNIPGGRVHEKALNLLFSPGLFVSTISMPSKLVYLAKLFSPVGFVSLLSPATLLLVLPGLLQNLLTNNPGQHLLVGQYNSISIAFIFISAIFGAFNLTLHVSEFLEKRNFKNTFQMVSAVVLVLLLLVTAAVGSTVSEFPLKKMFRIGDFVTNERTASLDELASRIPDGASVSVSDGLSPHVAGREQLYLFPVHSKEADYVFLDKEATWPLTKEQQANFTKEIIGTGSYDIVEVNSWGMLYRRR